MRGGGGLVAAALLVAACGSGAGGAPQPESGALATPHPLAVQAVADATKAASAVIGPSGGQVTATAASGASMTLAIPAGALLSSHTITVTPLASIAGLPLKGGLLAGAQLGPDGLLLAKAATLTVTLSKGPPGGMNAYGFGYHQDGGEFHLAKANISGTKISIAVWHFSGAGVGAGTSGDANAQAASHAPTAPEDQVDQAQAAAQQVVPLLLGWEATLDGELGQQSPNLALLDTIYQQAFVFDAMASAAGRPDLARTLDSKIGLVLKTAAQLALTRCTSDPDAVQGLRVVRWLEWAQGHPLILQDLDAASLEAGVLKCLRFQLDFTTTVDSGFAPEAVNLSVESKDIAVNAVSALPLKFAPGYGALKYDSFVWIVPGIRYTYKTATVRQFSVQDLSMNLDASESGDANAVVDGMTITVDFGLTDETVTVIGPFPVTLPLKSFYANGMQNTHHDSEVGPNLYKIAPWTASSKPAFATAHQAGPCTEGPCVYVKQTQDTLFVLRHTPQQH